MHLPGAGQYLGSIKVLVQQQQQVACHQLCISLAAEGQERLLSCPVPSCCIAPARADMMRQARGTRCQE